MRLQRGGFGEYLVKVKVISRQQLLAVLQCHYRDRCKVGEAADQSIEMSYVWVDLNTSQGSSNVKTPGACRLNWISAVRTRRR